LEPYEEEKAVPGGHVKAHKPFLWPLTGRFATGYKYWMLAHSLYVCIIVVFRISFENKPPIGVVLFDFYMDIVYLIDMFRIFNQPYFNENGKLETVKKRIAMRYLKSWLLFDIYSFYPLAFLRFRSSREDGGYDDAQNFLQ
jgi:hypothetical protein